MSSETILNASGRMQWKQSAHGYTARLSPRVWFQVLRSPRQRWVWRGRLGAYVNAPDDYNSARGAMRACKQWVVKYIAPEITGARSGDHDGE